MNWKQLHHYYYFSVHKTYDIFVLLHILKLKTIKDKPCLSPLLFYKISVLTYVPLFAFFNTLIITDILRLANVYYFYAALCWSEIRTAWCTFIICAQSIKHANVANLAASVRLPVGRDVNVCGSLCGSAH